MCLTEVLWGERIGLLSIDERGFTVYFAQFPWHDSTACSVESCPCRSRNSSTEREQGKRISSLPLHPSPNVNRGESVRHVPGLNVREPLGHSSAPTASTAFQHNDFFVSLLARSSSRSNTDRTIKKGIPCGMP
jgi:hypothetical protein